MKTKPQSTKQGIVKRIIKPRITEEPEKAEITIDGADPLYREIRVENTLQDPNGKEVKLKEGAHVDVILETDAKNTEPKP
jgi:hypothetical protein